MRRPRRQVLGRGRGRAEGAPGLASHVGGCEGDEGTPSNVTQKKATVFPPLAGVLIKTQNLLFIY